MIFCGGEEKLAPGPLEDHYGRPVESDPDAALARLAPDAARVVDLADEPVLPAGRKLGLAALALHLGLAYEAPGARLDPPRYAEVSTDAPKLAVIGTGKRTGKTAVAGHWAALLRGRALDPVIVCMGRGGPAEPRTAPAGTGLDELLEADARGEHAASDYLEDAVLAGVPTVGCRRVGGGLAGAPAESNVAAGAALAAAMDPGAIVFEGSGACIPPVEVDRTVCVLGAGVARAVRGVPAAAGRSRAGRRGRAGTARSGALLAAPRAGRAAARGRDGGALHHRRRSLRGSRARWWRPPTWPAAPRWRRISTGRPRRAATSTSRS